MRGGQGQGQGRWTATGLPSASCIQYPFEQLGTYLHSYDVCMSSRRRGGVGGATALLPSVITTTMCNSQLPCTHILLH